MIALEPGGVAQYTWLGISLSATAFAMLVAALKLYAAAATPHPETVRKLLHVGAGLLTLPFPFLFADVWPVLLLTGGTTIFLAAVRLAPRVRCRFRNVVEVSSRTTFGELYFPVSVAVVFWLSHGQSALLFVIPILVLSIADAACALIGIRFGTRTYGSSNKTLEGSGAFAVAAFCCIEIPLSVWGSRRPIETLLISSTLALLLTLLEGTAWRGLDNLFIAIGGFFALQGLLVLDVNMLQFWILMTLALAAVIVMGLGTGSRGGSPTGRGDAPQRGTLATELP
jgi:phytol kinase